VAEDVAEKTKYYFKKSNYLNYQFLFNSQSALGERRPRRDDFMAAGAYEIRQLDVGHLW
jgi:hypothetical protein